MYLLRELRRVDCSHKIAGRERGVGERGRMHANLIGCRMMI